ncbi:MAG: SdrD B-like domain-containing protein [bacterium]|nr:GEVED domain-containing protein [candidate division KSB1 bacterium]MDH7558857.1 SdrD B-like domain-containing protein [bacterium]
MRSTTVTRALGNEQGFSSRPIVRLGKRATFLTWAGLVLATMWTTTPATGQAAGTLLSAYFGVSLRLAPAPSQEAHAYAPTGLPFDLSSFVPRLCPPGLDMLIPTSNSSGSDWYGYWSSTSISGHEDYWGQWPSGSEPYDVEAYYASVDQDNFYIAVVTSCPGPQAGGIHETRSGLNVWIRPGDLALDMGLNSLRTTGGDNWRYDFGVDIVHEKKPDPWVGSYSTVMYDNSVGSELYRTNNSDWYTSCDRYATTAHKEYTNFDPLAADFSGTLLGTAAEGVQTAYYQYDLNHDGQLDEQDLECGYATYVVEAIIPRALLGADNPQPGDTVKVRWVEGCRNDGNSNRGVAFLVVVLDASLGDRVWMDLNRNGIQEEGEEGIEGVAVYLLSEAGQPLDSTSTNENGLYAFYNLLPGSYRLKFVLPRGYGFSRPNQGSDDELDSDVDPYTGLTEVVTLIEGENNFTLDAGACRCSDFGDAPDPTYPTLLSSNGAHHTLGDVWMGATVDAEWDGQPVDGDSAGVDDEDGVEFLGSSPVAGGPYQLPYRPGWYGAVRITVGGTADIAYLHGWYDWNGDGDWNDAGERLFTGYPVSGAGVYTVEFAVPSGAKAGGSWSRFRIDEDNTSSQPTGGALNGEVEDYDPTAAPVEEQLLLDFGDAPDTTYPSHWINDGAAHVIGDIWLGSGVSDELDTKQIDLDEYDDGINFLGYAADRGGPFINGGSFSPGDYAAIEWIASGNISEENPASLHIWIDWDRSGSWEHPGEVVVDTTIVSTGSGTAVFRAPEWLAGQPLGTTWLRARLDRAPVGTQTPTGLADNGEVEDYGDLLVDIELSSFQASGEIGKVVLSWQTESETENLGFHLYRAQEERGSYQRITRELIPGAGTSSEKRSYTFEDTDVQEGMTYYYRLADVDFRGAMRFHGPVSATVRSAPRSYELEQNYPNPFNPTTTIGFTLPEQGHATIRVYNMLGQQVKTLVDGQLQPRRHVVSWDGTDDQGNAVPTGLYVYTLTVNGYRATRKMAFTK